MKKFRITTDGSCIINPGPMGYAAIIEDLETGERREIVGFDDSPDGTNNQSEIIAAINGLAETPAPSIIELVSDSQQVTGPYLQGWLEAWRGRAKEDGSWRNSQKKKVPNQALYEDLDLLVQQRNVTFVHKHRNSTADLKLADCLAKAQAHRGNLKR